LHAVSSDEPLLTFIFSARLPRRIPNVQSVRRACDGFAEFLNECKALPSGFEHVVTAAFIVSTVFGTDVPSKAWFAEMKHQINDLAKCGIYIQVHTVDFGGVTGPFLSDLNALSLDPKRAIKAMTSQSTEVPAVINELGVVMVTDTPTINVVIRPSFDDADSISCSVALEATGTRGAVYAGRGRSSKRGSTALLSSLKDLHSCSEVDLPLSGTLIKRVTTDFGPPLSSPEDIFSMQARAFKDHIWNTLTEADRQDGAQSGDAVGGIKNTLATDLASTMKVTTHLPLLQTVAMAMSMLARA
jgi:hypothetical protein